MNKKKRNIKFNFFKINLFNKRLSKSLPFLCNINNKNQTFLNQRFKKYLIQSYFCNQYFQLYKKLLFNLPSRIRHKPIPKAKTVIKLYFYIKYFYLKNKTKKFKLGNKWVKRYFKKKINRNFLKFSYLYYKYVIKNSITIEKRKPIYFNLFKKFTFFCLSQKNQNKSFKFNYNFYINSLVRRVSVFRINRLYKTPVKLNLKFRWKRLNFEKPRVSKNRRKKLRRKLLIQKFISFSWKIKKIKTFKKYFFKYGKKPFFRVKNILNIFNFRLDSFLVNFFKINALRYARALILLGHIYVNGSPMKFSNYKVNRFDIVSFTKKSLKWIKLLNMWRRKKIKRRARRSRKFFSGLSYGPGRRWAVYWDFIKVHKLTKGSPYHTAKIYIPSKKQIRFLLIEN